MTHTLRPGGRGRTLAIRHRSTSANHRAGTSLTATQASPAGLAAVIRGHWAIEDRLHWVRDMDFDEDRSQVRAASGPASWPACAT